MKIVIVDKTAVIPVKKYGGTERIIWDLGKELSRLRHQVFFLVAKGSTCDFATVLNYDPQKDMESQLPEATDIVHFNHVLNEVVNKPYLITMHGNPSREQKIDANTVFISENQAKRYSSTVFVYNGLDWGNYPKVDLTLPREGFHFLGKVAWKIKNVFGAAKIALKSGHKLHILGGGRWTFRNFKRGFQYLVNPKLTFHGMVDNNIKMEIMKRSKALVFPVLWHEPFGLAIIESLYAGCAVFGTQNGSLPELITPEVGFVGTSSEEIVKAIQEFEYNPKVCHEYALNRFNAKVMTASYLRLYEKVILGETLNSEIPKYVEKENLIPKFS